MEEKEIRVTWQAFTKQRKHGKMSVLIGTIKIDYHQDLSSDPIAFFAQVKAEIEESLKLNLQKQIGTSTGYYVDLEDIFIGVQSLEIVAKPKEEPHDALHRDTE